MATMTNISEKYKDIIFKSIPIHPGSPAVYQLKPERKEFGSLSRLTVGEQDVNKENKTILLVGETGTGKSTLINTLVNYTMGVKFEDDVWFEIVEEEKRRQCESQTSDVIVYEIFGFEDQTLPFSLTIIDTPGFGDTRGIEHDLIINQRLFDLFHSDEGVHEIDAVGLVLKATDNRLSERLLYVFDSVMSLFGKNLEKNIVALVTHSDGRKPKNALDALDTAKIKCARNEKNEPVHFLFNNQQRTERTQRNKKILGHAWEMTKGEMDQFTDFLKDFRPQKLMTAAELLNESIRLAACSQNLQERICLIELKQAEIQQTREALKKYEEMKKNENFSVEVDEAYKEKETIEGEGGLFYVAAVTCNICEENCHYPGCTVAQRLEHCEVMRTGRCTSCTHQCPASEHVKEKWIYVNMTKKVTKTLTELKEKYEQNKAEGQKKLSLLENLEEEMKTLTANKDQWLEDTYKHVVRLEQMPLNVESESTRGHLDFLIEKMKEKGDREKVKKLEEVRSRVDDGVVTTIIAVRDTTVTSQTGNKLI